MIHFKTFKSVSKKKVYSEVLCNLDDENKRIKNSKLTDTLLGIGVILEETIIIIRCLHSYVANGP